jgi:hypothetical protein
MRHFCSACSWAASCAPYATDVIIDVGARSRLLILMLVAFDHCPAFVRAMVPLAFPRGKYSDCAGRISLSLPIKQKTGAQRPYRPVNVALAKVWKCRSNPTSAAEAASFLASGSLSTSTANTVIW